MNSNTRIKFAGLILLGVALVGTGCAQKDNGKVINNEVSMPVSSDQKLIEIGGGLRIKAPKEWSVSVQGGAPEGNIIYFNKCSDLDNSKGAIFCEIRVLVTAQDSGPEALLEFSNKDREFSWFCAEGKYGQCSTEQDKLSQIEKKEGYWTAGSVGITDNAAVAFDHDGKFIVVFGTDSAEDLYQAFSASIE